MDNTPRPSNGAGLRSPLLARVSTLTLAASLLAGCGADGADTYPATTPSAPATSAGTSDETSATSDETSATSATSEETGQETTSEDAAGDDDGEEAAEEIVIVIEDFTYVPPDSVPAGAEIVVRNMDGVGHTVTADDGSTFDVIVGPGEEVSFAAPSEAGEYPFHCRPHPQMTSTLVVEEDGP